jgi:tripartite-type tricarboxylate transporter receptor subunit TctC
MLQNWLDETSMAAKLTVMALAVCAIGMLSANDAMSQSYPSRPITLVVPYPAGGGVDAMARMVGQKLSLALKQQVVVENRGGGNGNVGTRAVAKAKPDGYTLLLGYTGTLAVNPSLTQNAGYDPIAEFAPIGMIASMPAALIAHPSFPGRTVADVIALARKEPGKLAIATGAIGTVSYLCAELFKSMAGLDVTIVPYRGTAPQLSDLIAGHVQVGFGVVGSAMSNIQGGTLRALAVTTTARSSMLPDVPTVLESGLPNFDASLRYGLVAPAGTPRPIIDQLNKELRGLLRDKDITQRVAAEGGDVAPSTPEEYGVVIAQEIAIWSALIKKLDLKM